MRPLIGIVTLGACNRRSVESALYRAGARVSIVSDTAGIRSCDGLVLPGVANFGYVVRELDRLDLRAPLLAAFGSGMPVLGICAGFQLLFDSSQESAGMRGLGIFSGVVQRVRTPHVPHIGWNLVRPLQRDGIGEGWAYFANAFAPDADVPDAIATTRDGDFTFACAAKRGSAIGMQFHPERSGEYGAELLGAFVESATVRRAR